MDDLFAPPGTPWVRVSSRLAARRRLDLAVGVGIAALAGALVAMVWLPDWVLALWIVSMVMGFVWAWWLVARSAASWAYAERDEDLYITHGVMVRHLVAVPYGRMQYVDVHAGLVDRWFGLADVHLHTASPGTSARIPGLTHEEAGRLRDRLTSLGETQVAGL